MSTSSGSNRSSERSQSTHHSTPRHSSKQKTHTPHTSRTSNTSRSSYSSDSSDSYETDSEYEYSSDDDENPHNSLEFDNKKLMIRDILDEFRVKEMGHNPLSSGNWCKNLKFIHVSKDRLSTVGTGCIVQNRDVNFIWKMCQSWDYTLLAEYKIMKQLEEMFEWCPHFVRAFDLVEIPIHPSFMTEPEKFVPFQSKGKEDYTKTKYRECKNHFLLMEELDGHLSVYDYFGMIDSHNSNNSKVNSIIYSILNQTLLSLYNANLYCDFTHYDAHSSNVLIEDTNDEYRLYVSPGTVQFIKTYGLSTVIIDTGYSYSTALLNGDSLDTCITNFTTGYTPVASNINHDFRTFLLNVVADYPDNAGDIRRQLKDFVKATYKRKHVDMENGWLKLKRDKIFVLKNYINDITKICSRKSIFYDHSIQSFDVFSKLLKLPFTQKASDFDMKNHKEKFVTFYRLFARIENKLGDGITFRKYIWKKLIEYIHEYTLEEFIVEFPGFLASFGIVLNEFSHSHFYESVINYVRCYEQAVIKSYNEIQKQCSVDFENVPSPVDIIKIIDNIYKPNYTIDESDFIYVYDSVNKRKELIAVDNVVEFNKLSHDDKIQHLLSIYSAKYLNIAG